jgi:hypothetical protein
VALKNHKDLKLKIGLKYCGGCNPTYDRVALVKKIERRLRKEVEFVSPESEGVDLVLAVQGCSTACADLSAFRGMEIRTITRAEDTENFVKELHERVIKHSLE